MRSDTGQKVVSFSITQRIKDYLSQTYPLSHNAYDVARKVHCKESTARRTLSRLAKEGNTGVRRFCKGFYIGVINKENFGNLEYPEINMHNIKLQFEPIGTKKRDSPPALNTLRTNQKRHQINTIFYWNWDSYPYKVVFQFNPMDTITLHLNASKQPIDQIGFRDFYNWIQGVFTGLKLNIEKYEVRIISAELNLDYRKVTIAPKMLTIRDLKEKSFLRLYQKYSNLTRIEVGTTFDGEKAIYQLFIDFVKPAFQNVEKDDFKDVA